MHSTKCAAYFDLSRHKYFPDQSYTFHVYVEHPLWCNTQMYDAYSAYRNYFLYAVILWYSGLMLIYTRRRNYS